MKDISKLPLKKVKLGTVTPSYAVKWALYKDLTPIPKNGIILYPQNMSILPSFSSGVCYANLITQFKNLCEKKKKPNRLYTELELNSEPNNKSIPILLRKEMRDWIELCIKHGMLPSYLDPVAAVPSTKKGILVLNLVEANDTITYLYLASFRHIRENPSLVKSVLYLHKEHGVNFFIAFILSSHFNMGAEGHHSIKATSSPYSYNKPVPKKLTEALNLKAVCALYRAINDKDAIDPTPLTKASRWHCNGRIAEVCDQEYVVPISDLFYPELTKLVQSVNEEESQKQFKLYKKSKKESEQGVREAIKKIAKTITNLV